MNKISLLILFIIFCYSILSADEIYLKNSEIIQCEIIQITDKNIEYREKDGRPFEVINKSLVLKVSYDDGRVIDIADDNIKDQIFLTDGSILSVRIVQVTPEVVIYIAEGSDRKEALLRDNIKKIVYSDGKEVLITDTVSGTETSPLTVEIRPEEVQQETIAQIPGYADSFLRFGLTGGIGFLWGDLHNKENHAFDRNKNLVPTYPIAPSDDKESNIENDRYHGGFELGILLPAIKIPQTRAFGLSGVKFGITTSYIFSYVEQSLMDNSLEKDYYAGMLLKYNTINAGPEMNMIFGPKSNKVNMVFRCYILGGYIHQGELRAVPGLREAGLSLSRSEYATGFTGYSATTGAGLRFVSNVAFPVIAGLDLQYTYSKINFDRSLPVYNGADSSSFSEIGLVMSTGVHF